MTLVTVISDGGHYDFVLRREDTGLLSGKSKVESRKSRRNSSLRLPHAAWDDLAIFESLVELGSRPEELADPKVHRQECPSALKDKPVPQGAL